jgi:hypothetical protein
MLLVNVRPFGNFKPGETVEVPDGAGFDHAYFERADEEPTPVEDEAPDGAEEVSE